MLCNQTVQSQAQDQMQLIVPRNSDSNYFLFDHRHVKVTSYCIVTREHDVYSV